MPKFAKILGAVAALTVVGLLVVFGRHALRDKETRIGPLLEAYGFTELQPPSTLTPPGYWVVVKGSEPLSVSTLCRSWGALGFPSEYIPKSSPSMTAELQREVAGDLAVGADVLALLQARPVFQVVEDVSLSLKNVKVAEVADDEVLAAIRARSTDCHEAIKARVDDGQSVTMIKSALYADAEYRLSFAQNASADAKLAALRELALDLDLRIDVEAAQHAVLSGQGLIWGVRDDAFLAEQGLGLPATGSASREERQILQGQGPIREVEQDEDDALMIEGRRVFPLQETVVRLDVTPKRQTSQNACWATVYAMMLEWRAGADFSPADAVRQLGANYVDYFVYDAGLPPGKELEFVALAGMTATPPANYPMSTLAEMLSNSGPLWVSTGDGFSSHARLLVGIYSPAFEETSSAYDDTTFELIDPATGSFAYLTARDFMTEFEAEAWYVVERLNEEPLRWQIIRWGSPASL